jgi:hsp70-interacting protein
MKYSSMPLLTSFMSATFSPADLHKIGGLPTLLSLMSSPHPSLRWRAAELAATCMANNPPVQRWFMEGGALAPLLALLADSHPVVVTKAVLGLSALVRHYNLGLEVRRCELHGRWISLDVMLGLCAQYVQL